MNDSVIQFRGTVYENGYGLIAQKVMRDKDLTPVAKSIYAYICSFAGVDKEGNRSAFPGVTLMMRELGIKTDDTYYKHRKILIDKGYITIEKNRNVGKFQNNIYYVESVPVEVEEIDETKENNVPSGNSPYPKKQGKDSPYPKKSSTVKSSTTKKGTNSTRFNSTRFKEEEDTYTGNNESFKQLQKTLKEKNIDQKTINKIINIFLSKNNHQLSLLDIENQHAHIMEKINNGIPIYDYAIYFSNGLIEKTKQKKASMSYKVAKINEQQNRDTSVYYNWVEDQ